MSRRRIRVLIMAAVALALLHVVYVPQHQVAVREAWGGAATPLAPGFHLRVPIVQRLYRYDTRPVSIDEPVEIITKDAARFKLPVRLAAWPSSGDVLTFHRGRSGREPVAYLRERVRASVQSAARSFDADEVLTSDLTRRLAPVISADLIAIGIASDGFSAGRVDPQVVLNAVVDYLRRRFPASARRLAENFLRADPKESRYHTAMGMVLEADGRKAEAEKAYLDALYLDPASPEPMSRLYVFYQGSNDPQAILRLERLLTASLEKNAASPIHNDWLGQVYLRTGRYDKAEMAFNAAIGQAPDSPEFRVSLGTLRVRQGKLDDAKTAYEEALRLRPDHHLALFNLGVVQAMQGNLDRALDAFHRAERSGEPNHALFNALAQAYEGKGQLDRAAEYLRRSLQLRPDQPDRKAELRAIQARLRTKK